MSDVALLIGGSRTEGVDPENRPLSPVYDLKAHYRVGILRRKEALSSTGRAISVASLLMTWAKPPNRKKTTAESQFGFRAQSGMVRAI